MGAAALGLAGGPPRWARTGIATMRVARKILMFYFFAAIRLL
jgi:hypothetical protein